MARKKRVKQATKDVYKSRAKCGTVPLSVNFPKESSVFGLPRGVRSIFIRAAVTQALGGKVSVHEGAVLAAFGKNKE